MKEQLEQPRTTKAEKDNETKEQKPKTSPIGEKTSKEQKSETPPTEIIKEQKPKLPTSTTEGSDVKKAEMPSIEDINALLEKSKEVITVALISEKEIDEMIKKRKQALDHLQIIEAIRESQLKSRLKKVNDFNPHIYKQLAKKGIINELYADQLEKIDEMIEIYKNVKNPSENVKAQLNQLLELKDSCHKNLKSQIEIQQQESETRREKTRKKVLEHYTDRVEKLKKTIADIESNPRVIERLKKEQEEKRKETIKKVIRYIQSANAKHDNTFKKRLKELFENDKLVDELVAALDEKDTQKKQSIFGRVRKKLIEAIIDGKGEKQLKDPKEIMPWWETKPISSIPYREVINFLRSPEVEEALQTTAKADNEQEQKQARELLEKRDRIKKERKVIQQLVGSRWIINPKTNERKKGIFWAAFDTRKKNDREGITAARAKKREEVAERKAAFEKAAEEIIKRGGFFVEVPIIKNIHGEKKVIGKRKGVVRLEKRKSPKRITGSKIKGDNEYWTVIEILNVPEEKLKIGDTSPLDMKSFPYWLRKSAIHLL